MTWMEKFEQMLDRQAWLESSSQVAQQAVQKAYAGAGPAGIKVRDALHGVWQGHPLHAVVTDVTVGAVIVAVFLDGLESMLPRKRGVLETVRSRLPGSQSTPLDSLASAADASLALGITSGLVSGLTGATDWQHTMDRPRRVGFLHALLNVSSLVLYSLSYWQRKQGNRQAGKALSLAGMLFTTGAGYLGGHLAYGFKIGMNRAPVEGLPEKFTPVLDETALSEGKPVVAYYKDIPLVLVRRGSAVYALAETCAHMGGPLAEGQVAVDETAGGATPVIVCPWHGSRFALESGAIQQGPSVYPQPCFETRLRQGKVEVRVRPDPDLHISAPAATSIEA